MRFHRRAAYIGLSTRKESAKEGRGRRRRAEEKEEKEVGHEGGTVPTVYTMTRTKTWRNGTLALCKSVKRLKDSPHGLPSLRSLFSRSVCLPRVSNCCLFFQLFRDLLASTNIRYVNTGVVKGSSNVSSNTRKPMADHNFSFRKSEGV